MTEPATERSGFVCGSSVCPTCRPRPLPPFPVDDVTLDAVEHALDAVLTYDELGGVRIVGADMSLPALLDFLSGYDPEKVAPFEDESGHTHDDITEYVGGPLYTRDCIIRALITEVRRLRGATDGR